jgi:hypothetical protein
VKSTVPVGVGAPAGAVTVAVSVNVWPSVIASSLTAVTMVGVTCATTTVSPGSLQRPETAV